MTKITSQMVKELRERTGSGIMDCKNALIESDGDYEKAIDYLRIKGLAGAQKKSSRAADEGVVIVKQADNKVLLLEVNCETDFVAKTDKFQQFCTEIMEIAWSAKENVSVEELLEMPSASTKGLVKDEISNLIATIGENIVVRNVDGFSVSSGHIETYIHNKYNDSMGKIAVAVGLESDKVTDEVKELGKHLAMHIAAAKPLYLNEDSISQETLEREKGIILEQTKQQGKPTHILEKIVTNKLQKFVKDNALSQQDSMLVNNTSISQLIKDTSKQAGTSVTVRDFRLLELGSGADKSNV